MAAIVDPSVPRMILTDDGVNAIGTAARPLQLTIAGIDFDAVNGALAGADAPINVNGQNITGIGDLSAVGGFRQSIGPFFDTTAADQTAVGTKFGDTVGQTWVAPRAGSITGVSGMIDGAVTGAGKSIKARVYKNGSLVNAALDLDFTQAGAEVKDFVAVAKDTYTFVAGDELKVVYTTDTITNTPKLNVNIEVEC